MHLHINRGKRSVVLDLRTDEGVAIFLELVRGRRRRRRGDAARAASSGAGSASTSSARSTRRSCSARISGYGATGPYQRPAEPRHRLRHVGRHRHARGRRRRASPTSPSTCRSASTPARCSARSASSPASSGPARPARAARWRSRSPTPPPRSTGSAARPAAPTSVPSPRSPATQPTTTSAGRPAPPACASGVRYQIYEIGRRPRAVHGVSEQEFWKNFCEALDRTDLFERWPGVAVRRPRPRQPRAAARAHATSSRRGPRPSGSTSASEHNTPIAPVNTPKTLADDPQFQDRLRLAPGERARRRPAADPDQVRGRGACRCRPRRRSSASTPTRCSRDVLGYDDEKIAELREAGALG